jgi:hypothetical protein
MVGANVRATSATMTDVSFDIYLQDFLNVPADRSESVGIAFGTLARRLP